MIGGCIGHTSGCLESGFTHWRTTTPIGGCIGHTSGCLKNAKVRVFEAKCEQIAQAYGLVMS